MQIMTHIPVFKINLLIFATHNVLSHTFAKGQTHGAGTAIGVAESVTGRQIH